MTDNYKHITDTGLAELLRANTRALKELLAEFKERNISVCILAKPFNQSVQYAQNYNQLHTHQLTQHDQPVVSSITRTKSETF